jgi:hypothetical protein
LFGEEDSEGLKLDGTFWDEDEKVTPDWKKASPRKKSKVP